MGSVAEKLISSRRGVSMACLACLVSLSLVSWTMNAELLLAQEGSLIASADELRAAAAARGYSMAPAGQVETWCVRPPCGADVDRYELRIAEGQLVELRVRITDAADGFSLDASWQASGAFSFQLTRGDERIDLGWELTFEHPMLAVAFSARRLEDITALDSNDGARAFALWIRRELGRHLASPRSLLEVSLAARAALRANAARALRSSGTVRDRPLAECLVERSTGQGTGIFDECPLRLATPQERRAVLAALDARLAMERRILRAHAPAFHRAIREALTGRP